MVVLFSSFFFFNHRWDRVSTDVGLIEYNPFESEKMLVSFLRIIVYNFRMVGSKAKWWLENMVRQAGQKSEHCWDEGRKENPLLWGTTHPPGLLQMALLAQSLVLKLAELPHCETESCSAGISRSVVWKICPALFHNGTGHKYNLVLLLHLETLWDFEAKK